LDISIRSGDICAQSGKVSEIGPNLTCFSPPPHFSAERNRLQRVFKIRAKENHEAFITRTVEEVEEGIKSNHLSPAFKAIKVLAGNKPAQAMSFINKADGSPCTSPEETLHRWREHFTAALNHPTRTRSDDLDTEADTTTRDTDTPADAPSLDETISAIRKLRNGRAAGPDGIPPELLKCAIGLISTALHAIFTNNIKINCFKPYSYLVDVSATAVAFFENESTLLREVSREFRRRM